MTDGVGSMKKRHVRGWSELCPELLIKFFAALNSSDQLAFRGVCKGWHSASLAAQEEFKTGKTLISHSEFPDHVSDNKQAGTKRKSFTSETYSMRKRRNVILRWSKLCPELLKVIYSFIDSTDQWAFRCVCKGWRSAVHTATEDLKEHELVSRSKFQEDLKNQENLEMRCQSSMAMNSWSMSKKKNVSGEWSELFTDLLIELYAGLDVLDQMAFRGVCKGWRSAALSAPEEQKQLWLMYRPDYMDPRVKRSIPNSCYYFVNYSSSERPTYLCSLPNLDNCAILTAKHGWLLMAGPYLFDGCIHIFFYNPFTCTTITIPPLTHPSWFLAAHIGSNRNQSMFDFTSPPTSSECTVVVVFYRKMMNWLVTSSWRHGQAAWAMPVDHRGFSFAWVPLKVMVFHDGSFYSICNNQMVGKILAFHPDTNTVKSLSGCPGQTDPGKGETGAENVLCDLLSPNASYELVERVGGLEFVSELVRWRESRRRPLRVVKAMHGKRYWDDTTVALGELEIGYPLSYHPFLRKEKGQLMVVQHHSYFNPHKRLWITKRGVHHS